MLNYNEIRQLATRNGIADNKVSIGIWIKIQGYKKVRKQIDGKRKIYYVLDKNSVCNTDGCPTQKD